MRKNWFAALLVGAMVSTPAFATTITIVNQDGGGEGFNDNTSAAPVGGNTGTTRGAQRLRVFQAAANQWAALLDSNVPIRVDAQFDALECNGDSAVLGAAGPIDVAENFTSAPRANTWYPIALANAIRGTDIIPARNDIVATFNSSIDNNTCLTGTTWWYGVDPAVPVPAGKIALLPVVFHELAHGLGFLTITDEATGQFFDNTPDVWAFNMRDRSQNRLWSAMSNAQRASSAINDPSLVWDGTNVNAALSTFLRSPPQLHVLAPAGIAGDYTVQPASFGTTPPAAGITGNVVKALDGTNPFNDACSALNNSAQMAGKIALIVRGNCDFTVKVKNAQNAGAIGALVFNNAAGLPPMGGSDATIAIPAYGISQVDGNAIAAFSDNTVSVNLGFDVGAPLAGTDGGLVRLYAPNPIEPGSSLSHFSDEAFPDLLMEPALNQSLFDKVDLTLPLFKDIGWPLEANDAPTINAPGSLNGTEDTARNITGISFADADAGAATVQATFSIASGAITATSASGVIVSGTDNARVLTGTIAALNAFINANALHYVPAANANGTIVLTVLIDDLGNSGDGGARTATRNVNVVLSAVNDAPTVTVPATLPVNEDTITPIDAVVLADIDAGTNAVRLTLTVATGTLGATAQGGDNVTVTGNNTATLVLNGTLAALNAFIQNDRVRFTPVANATGNVALTLAFSDLGNSGTGGTLVGNGGSSLQVIAFNDAPVLGAPTTLPVGNDGLLTLSGITLTDVDAGTAAMTLRFTATAGTLAATPQGGDNVTVTGNSTAVLTLTGSASAIQAFVAAGRVRYTQAPGASGNATLTLLANDNGNTGGGGPLTATRDITLIVAVNDAPTIAIAPIIAVNQSGASALTGIVLGDTDAGTGSLTLTATVQTGTLSASGTGVTVTGNNTATLTLQGTLSALNALLAANGLVFTPAAGQTVADALHLVLNDNGNSGTGGAQTVTADAVLALEILFADGFE